MSTRSDIIAQCADGTWARIYCHSDGYLSHNGRILFDHYTSQSQIDALIALGDLSVLGPEIGVKHPFDSPSYRDQTIYDQHQRLYGRMCRAYGRDRGEAGTGASRGATIQAVWPEQNTWTEFTYVWTEGQWFVGDPDAGTQTLVNLGDALQGKIGVTPSVKAFGMVLGTHTAHDPKRPTQHKWKSK